MAYDDSYYGKSETKFSSGVESFVHRCRGHRARRLARLLQSGSRVVDVGCGNGGFLASLQSVGDFDLHGIELPGRSAERAASIPGLHLKVGVLEQSDFAESSVDLVTLFHVFEHLTDPQETLRLIHRMLKANGRLVMSFPNISSVQARVFRDRWLHLDPPRHLVLFPTNAFERAIAQAGFRVDSRRFFSLEQNPFGLIQSLLNRFLKDRDVLYERLKGNTAYAPQHGVFSVLLQKAFAALVLPPAVLLDAIESVLGRGATVEYTLSKLTHRVRA